MPPAKENNCAMCDWREMARRYEMAWNAKGEEVERLKKQLEIQKKKTELFRELSTIAEQTLHDQEQIFSKSQQIVSEDNKKDAYIKNLIDRIAEKDKLTAMLERQLAGAKAEKDTTWKPPAMDSRKRGRPKKAKTGKVDEHGINTDKYEKL